LYGLVDGQALHQRAVDLHVIERQAVHELGGSRALPACSNANLKPILAAVRPNPGLIEMGGGNLFADFEQGQE